MSRSKENGSTLSYLAGTSPPRVYLHHSTRPNFLCRPCGSVCVASALLPTLVGAHINSAQRSAPRRRGGKVIFACRGSASFEHYTHTAQRASPFSTKGDPHLRRLSRRLIFHSSCFIDIPRPNYHNAIVFYHQSPIPVVGYQFLRSNIHNFFIL